MIPLGELQTDVSTNEAGTVVREAGQHNTRSTHSCLSTDCIYNKSPSSETPTLLLYHIDSGFFLRKNVSSMVNPGKVGICDRPSEVGSISIQNKLKPPDQGSLTSSSTRDFPPRPSLVQRLSRDRARALVAIHASLPCVTLTVTTYSYFCVFLV